MSAKTARLDPLAIHQAARVAPAKLGGTRERSMSAKNARLDPLAIHQAARVAPAKLGGTRERTMRDKLYGGKTSVVHTEKHVFLLTTAVFVG